MKFFNIVGLVSEHPIVSTLFAIIYIIVTWNVVSRFNVEVVSKTRLFEFLRYHIADKWESSQLSTLGGLAFSLTIGLATRILLLATAPILWVILGYRDHLWELSQVENRKLRAEKERRKQDKIILENNRRREARRAWAAEHKLKLFVHTIDGITTVMTPDNYKKACEWTERVRLNGKWPHENLLCPTNQECPSYVFVTHQGNELIKENIGASGMRYKVAGLMSNLHDLKKEWEVIPITAPNIFVPWLNETIMSFDEQRRFFPDGATRDMTDTLITKQFPKELRPLGF